MASSFNILPPEIQAVVITKALEEPSEVQQPMPITSFGGYEKSTTLSLASVSSAFLDHVDVICRVHSDQWIDALIDLMHAKPDKPETICKYAATNASGPVASTLSLQRALPISSPLWNWLHCRHCDELEDFEEAHRRWTEEALSLFAQNGVLRDLVKKLKKVRKQIGTCPAAETLKPRVCLALRITLPPGRA